MENLKNILSSFKLKKELNPKIWDKSKGGEYNLKPEIRNNLLEIADDFIESLTVDVIVSDIIMTGSLANYNWSNYSDVDLHIIADFNQFPKNNRPLYDELFHLKKTVYGIKHDITIFGYDVELYVEDESIARDVKSAGRYSLLHDEWVVEPPKESVKINQKEITEKAKKWMKIIDGVEESIEDEDIDTAKKLIKKYTTKIRKFRECGLEKGGEYSDENLVFKILRRNGYLDRLKEMKDKLIDKKLSMNEQTSTGFELSPEQKSKVVKPNVEDFYKKLDSIDDVILQDEDGDYKYNEDVEYVQIGLDILGYDLPRFGVDGKFGPETANSVNLFKSDNQIKDGLNERFRIHTLVNKRYRKIIKEGSNIGKTISGIDELCYNPVTKSSGIIGYGYDGGKSGPQNWSNHDTHLHIGFTNKDVAMQVIDKAKSMGLNPSENWYADGDVEPVHTNGSFHYKVFKGEPKVGAGLDIGDRGGSKKEDLVNLIKWIYDTYENKSSDRTEIVGTEIGGTSKEGQKTIGSTITPKMVDTLVQRLKEYGLKPEDLEKYTNFKIDFSDVIVKEDMDFYKNILEGIGAPISTSNLKFLFSWRQAEQSTAKNNPFNTTFKLDSDEGMTIYNCINSSGEGLRPLSDDKCPSDSKPGVKNYSTPQYGLEATVKTLKLNRYECIVKGLREERPPIEISQCDCLKKWGTKDGIYTVLKSNKINPPKINMS